MIHNEEIFPSDDTDPPKNFLDICDVLCRRLLRATMHFYHHHYSELKSREYDGVLDKLTLRYCVFALKFKLFKSQDRVLPILDVLEKKIT